MIMTQKIYKPFLLSRGNDMQKLTKEQAVIVSAYTGFLAGDVMSEMHEYIENILDRPVFTHELGNKDICNEIKKKSKADFLEICYES